MVLDCLVDLVGLVDLVDFWCRVPFLLVDLDFVFRRPPFVISSFSISFPFDAALDEPNRFAIVDEVLLVLGGGIGFPC